MGSGKQILYDSGGADYVPVPALPPKQTLKTRIYNSLAKGRDFILRKDKPLIKPVMNRKWLHTTAYDIIDYPIHIPHLYAMVNFSPTLSAIRTNIRTVIWWKSPELKPKFKWKCEGCKKEFDDDPEDPDDPQDSDGPGKMPGEPVPNAPPTKEKKAFPPPDKAKAPAPSQFPPPQEEEDEKPKGPPKCDECGGELKEPDEDEKKRIEEFIKKANLYERSLWQELKMCEDDLQVADDLYIIFIRDYAYGNDGVVQEKELMEIIRGAPEVMRMVRDKRGRILSVKELEDNPPDGWYTCVGHRFEASGVGNVQRRPGKCKVCGAELVPCEYIALRIHERSNRPEIGFIEGEVLHMSKYAPSEFYGFSPVATVWTLVRTDLGMDSTRMFLYTKNRPPKGVLCFNSRNQASVEANWTAEMEEAKNDPYHLPIIFVDTEGKEFIKFETLTPDMSEMDIIEHKKDIRNQIANVFQIPPALMNDLSTSGGLNQEKMQLTHEMIFVAERGHQYYHEDIFPKIEEELDMKDWEIKFPRSIDADKNMEAARRGMNADVALKWKKMGANVQIVGEKDAEIKVTEPPGGLQEPKEESPFAGGPPGMGGGNKPPGASGVPGNKPGGAGGSFKPPTEKISSGASK